MSSQSYVWYSVYGSNLSRQRFLCYIVGGKPTFGKKNYKGCRNKMLPIKDKPCKISYSLYFALPEKVEKTDNWGYGGVAFINPSKKHHENDWTLGRMWKITNEQYKEVRCQEGCNWYNKEIELGKEDGIPIYTITNKAKLTNIMLPSDAYLRTMALRLKETYNLTDDKIAGLLLEKSGVKGKLSIEKLIGIISSASALARTL